MLTALDHIVLLGPDLDAGIATYQTLFGRGPDWVSAPHDGIATATFTVENTALELLAPVGDGATAKRIQDLLGDAPGRLTSLAFRTADIDQAHHVLGRRGLAPSDITHGSSVDVSSEKNRAWRRFRCDDDACAGIKTFVIQPDSVLPAPLSNPGDVTRLDHLVINTPNPDRAIAHYGARLGLRFALDRTIEAFKTRFLFFRTGGLTLEIIHRLDQDADLEAPDHIWGLTWAVDDLRAAHKRLSTAGLNISDIRTGRKPGTEVFTVREGTLGVPTLFIAADDKPATTPRG